jgi:hypothetical protein
VQWLIMMAAAMKWIIDFVINLLCSQEKYVLVKNLLYCAQSHSFIHMIGKEKNRM